MKIAPWTPEQEADWRRLLELEAGLDALRELVELSRQELAAQIRRRPSRSVRRRRLEDFALDVIDVVLDLEANESGLEACEIEIATLQARLGVGR